METEVRIERVLMQPEGASNNVEIDIKYILKTLDDGYRVKEIIGTEFVPQGGIQ